MASASAAVAVAPVPSPSIVTVGVASCVLAYSGIESVVQTAGLVESFNRPGSNATGATLITGPLGQMTVTMNALARGKLDVKLAGLDRHDEIGEMAKAVEVFKEALR